MRLIANDELTEADIPPQDAEVFSDVEEFALSFDGYKFCGSFDKCRDTGELNYRRWKENRKLPDTLDELRTCLFFAQRTWRWVGDCPHDDYVPYVKALFENIGEVQDYATHWLWFYNNDRPNTAIGGIPPARKSTVNPLQLRAGSSDEQFLGPILGTGSQLELAPEMV